MDFASNLLDDVFRYYFGILKGVYGEKEARSMLYLLIEGQLGISRLQILSNAGERLSESDILKIHKAVLQLKQHIPLQYILGETSFLDHRISVAPGVLIPRPETEELVKWVIDENAGRNEQLKILDIGTGSGCIAIALEKELSNADVFAIDVSEKAIDMAKQNNKINNTHVIFQQADLFKGNLPKEFPDSYDIIVSNPPYVRESEKKMMQANVLDHEPAEALFVKDEDPLLYYREIIKLAQKYLKKNGRIFFEINEYMQDAFRQLLINFPEYSYVFKKDLSQKTRMLKLDTE